MPSQTCGTACLRLRSDLTSNIPSVQTRRERVQDQRLQFLHTAPQEQGCRTALRPVPDLQVLRSSLRGRYRFAV